MWSTWQLERTSLVARGDWPEPVLNNDTLISAA